LKLAIAGSGSALPDPDRGNPSQALLIDDEVILFDCGERTTVNLVRAGINPLSVDELFFTHLHWDHIADLGYFMMTTWNCGRRDPVAIYGPSGTHAMVDASLHGVHAADVAFVRAYVAALPSHVTNRPAADPPFEVTDIELGFRRETATSRITTGRVEHHQRLGMPSLGYRVESDHGVVVLTGDTGPSDGVVELARGADVLVHDCAFLQEIIDARGMWSHSSPSIAGRHAEAAGVKTLVLTHLGPYTSPEPAVDMATMYYGARRPAGIWDDIVREAREHFSGEVILATDGLVLDVAKTLGKR
jgi:ribonuclease Z